MKKKKVGIMNRRKCTRSCKVTSGETEQSLHVARFCGNTIALSKVFDDSLHVATSVNNPCHWSKVEAMPAIATIDVRPGEKHSQPRHLDLHHFR